ncbi:MAG: hypothetical protein C0500_02335 [Sphingobium sp.]|nr:hypothetical protein [Sphingobium sp.]
MSKSLFIALLGSVAFALGGNAPTASLCQQANAVLPALACVESAHGVALAGDTARAQRLLELADAGVVRFKEYFGRQALRYAVAEGPDAIVPTETIAALRTADFKVVLPWLSEKVFREQTENSIRRAVTAQMAGKPPEAIEAAVQAGLKHEQDSPKRKEAGLGAVPHELGHEWYRIGYWPDAPLSEAKHYGGPGPDWLDEMSAVLMEAPDMFGERVKQFAKRYASYRNDPANADAHTKLMVDLPHYFSEIHPISEQVRALTQMRRAQGDKAVVMMLTGEEARKLADGGVRFYLQSAVAAQYLIDRTGNRQIFGRIAEAFARGETMAQWLGNKEPKGKLPRDLKALQADWLSWLDQRFPAESAKAA